MAGLEQDSRRRRRPAAQYRCRLRADISICSNASPQSTSASLNRELLGDGQDQFGWPHIAERDFFSLADFLSHQNPSSNPRPPVEHSDPGEQTGEQMKVTRRFLMNGAASSNWFESLWAQPRRAIRRSARSFPRPARGARPGRGAATAFARAPACGNSSCRAPRHPTWRTCARRSSTA